MVETIDPSANGTVTDTSQYYAQSGGPLLLQKTVTTSANGLVKTTGTAVNGDTTSDFWTTDSTTLNPDGSQSETVGNFNKGGLISETVTTTTANGLWKTTEVDANGAGGSNNPVFNLVTTDDTVLNASDGSRAETVTATAANGATVGLTATTTSADQQTITTDRYLDETGNVVNVDQTSTTQTNADGSITDTTVSYDPQHNVLDTITETSSGNGLSQSTEYQNGSGTAVDEQSDTTSYDSDGDGGTTELFQDTDSVPGTNFTTTRTTQTSGNSQDVAIALLLAGALSSTNAATFSADANENTSIADTGVTTQTTTDEIDGASSPSDTRTVVTSANQLATTTSTALGGANPYIVTQTSTASDGSKSKVTTYYDPAALSVVAEQISVDTELRWSDRDHDG